VPPGAVTLASILRSHGYRTAAFIAASSWNASWDSTRASISTTALSTSRPSPHCPAPCSSPAHRAAGSPGRDRRDGGASSCAPPGSISPPNAGQSVFAFIHLFDLHKPYPLSARRPAARHLGLRCATGVPRPAAWLAPPVAGASRVVGPIAGHPALRSRGEFGRPRRSQSRLFHLPEHAASAADDSLASGAPNYPARATQPAGLIDVAPTILEFLHLPAPPSFHGKQPAGAAPGRRRGRRRASAGAVYGETLHAHHAFGWAPLRSLRVGDYKFIEAPRPELYNLRTDPRERLDLFAKEPAKAGELRANCRSCWPVTPPNGMPLRRDISPQTRALLDSLGLSVPRSARRPHRLGSPSQGPAA